MEKQEFLMEICEISNGNDAAGKMKEIAIHLMKEAIKQMAKSGQRQYQINPRLNVNMNGVNIALPILLALDYFREEGFTVVDQGNGWMISW